MMDILEFITARPWLVALLLLGLATWIGSIVAIFKSPKFSRKWLWVILTLLTFTYQWEVSPGWRFGVGLPLGSLYVLWFWKFGRSPTPEQLERAAAHARPRTAAASKLNLVRSGYVAVALAVVCLLVWMLIGEPAMVLAAFGPSDDIRLAMLWSLSCMMAAIIALFLFLAYRPYWWGKLICALAALSWIGHGAMAFALLPMLDVPDISPMAYAAVPIVSGIVALACGILHQRADPRFGGSYLREEGRPDP
jgi:hypothetical protein